MIPSNFFSLLGSTPFSAIAVAATVVTAAAISAVLPIDVVGREVLSRTRPTVSDLVVALTAGAAAAYAQSRQDLINSIAGVAIAVVESRIVAVRMRIMAMRPPWRVRDCAART